MNNKVINIKPMNLKMVAFVMKCLSMKKTILFIRAPCTVPLLRFHELWVSYLEKNGGHLSFHYIIWLYVLEDSAGLKWFLKTDRKVILQIMTMDWSFLKLFSFYNKTKPMKKYICLQKPQNPDQIIYALIHLSRKKPFRVVWNSDFI